MQTQLFCLKNLGFLLLSLSATAVSVEDERLVIGDKRLAFDDCQKIDFIYPGTKWCGCGNIAEGYDDLGEEADTDACCRTHDHCPYSIPAWTTKDGLKNYLPFTASDCNCDEKFFDCLKGVGTEAANGVGGIYFNNPLLFCVKKPARGKCCKAYLPVIPGCMTWEEGICAHKSTHLTNKWNKPNSVAEIIAEQGKRRHS